MIRGVFAVVFTALAVAGLVYASPYSTSQVSGGALSPGSVTTTEILDGTIAQADVSNGYVDLSSTQASIAGAKTWTSTGNFSAGLTAGGYVSMGGLTSAITAGGGTSSTTQAGATLLTTGVNVVTSSPIADASLKLPDSPVSGTVVWVVGNTGATNAAKVFPFLGANINNLSANTGLRVDVPFSTAMFVAESTTKWRGYLMPTLGTDTTAASTAGAMWFGFRDPGNFNGVAAMGLNGDLVFAPTSRSNIRTFGSLALIGSSSDGLYNSLVQGTAWSVSNVSTAVDYLRAITNASDAASGSIRIGDDAPSNSTSPTMIPILGSSFVAGGTSDPNGVGAGLTFKTGSGKGAGVQPRISFWAPVVGASGTALTTPAGVMEILGDSISAIKKIVFDATDSTGTPGNATVNKPSGQAAFAAAGSAVVITNSAATTASIIHATLQTNDTTCVAIKSVVPAAGSFTINVNAACNATTNVGWVVFN